MRYSAPDLQRMAETALEAKAAGDVRWDLLLLRMQLATGLNHLEVERRVVRLARGQSA